MKKIIFVTNSTWNAYNFRKELIKDLAKDNYQVHIIAPIDDKASYFLKKKNIFLHDISLNTRSKNIFNDLKYMLILWRKFKEIKPDVVLNFAPNISKGLVTLKKSLFERLLSPLIFIFVFV